MTVADLIDEHAAAERRLADLNARLARVLWATGPVVLRGVCYWPTDVGRWESFAAEGVPAVAAATRDAAAVPAPEGA